MSDEVNLATLPSRLRNITGTDMAALLGMNKYSSPAKVWENKLNPQKIANIHTRRGTLMEPAVLEALYVDLRMKSRRHMSGTIERADVRIAATPDAYNKETGELIEAKTTRTEMFDKWYGEIPPHYHIQLHTQMLVTGIDSAYIAALEIGDPSTCTYDLIVWKVKRNEELESLMIQETARFWNSVETLGKAPRVDSVVKRRVHEILQTTAHRVYPTEVPTHRSTKEADQVSLVLNLLG